MPEKGGSPPHWRIFEIEIRVVNGGPAQRTGERVQWQGIFATCIKPGRYGGG